MYLWAKYLAATRRAKELQEAGESTEALFSTRPIDELAQLDDLFYGRAG